MVCVLPLCVLFSLFASQNTPFSATQSNHTFISCFMFFCLQRLFLPCWLKLHLFISLQKTKLEKPFLKVLSLPLLERSARYEKLSTSTKKPKTLQSSTKRKEVFSCHYVQPPQEPFRKGKIQDPTHDDASRISSD